LDLFVLLTDVLHLSVITLRDGKLQTESLNNLNVNYLNFKSQSI